MNISERTDAFITLGKFLQQFSLADFSENKELSDLNSIFRIPFEHAITIAGIQNPWFTDEFIRHACLSISQSLTDNKFNKWIHDYPELQETVIIQKKIGVIMAGNIPLAGFHDMISTIISGHLLYGKMSSKDNVLFPVIKEILCHLNPGFIDRIYFHESQLKNMDVIIASGSNNSSRYFEFYFRKHPHIIRKNRNSAAIINGDETKEELKRLGDDIFLYFGLGCRNVSKIFLPADYDPAIILSNLEDYAYLYNHNKYANNYQYYKAIFLVSRVTHLDNGFVLFKEDSGYASPVGVLYYEFYKSALELRERLMHDQEWIQCTVESGGMMPGSVSFGKSQFPELWEYADHIDTMKFLINL